MLLLSIGSLERKLNWWELVWPAHGLVSPVSVRERELSVRLKASVLLGSGITESQNVQGWKGPLWVI